MTLLGVGKSRRESLENASDIKFDQILYLFGYVGVFNFKGISTVFC